MVNEPHQSVSLPNRSYQALARSEIKKIASTVGFSEKRMAELEIIIAEITSNMVKHTLVGGVILVKAIKGEYPGIELISIDNGPGMESITKMMEDGMSSTNTLGHGLGAIKRLSDNFDMYSMKDWGTVMLSRFYQKAPEYAGKKNTEIKVVMLPKEGETVCGDAYECVLKGGHLKFALSDGLGHGKEAHAAAIMSMREFRATLSHFPDEQLKNIHQAIKKTRGAVMNITHIDFNSREMSYCGIGNISSKLISLGKTKSCVSYNGIVGHSIPGTINNHSCQWAKTDILVIHSDGLSTRWDLQKYPQINTHDASIIAAVLYKDFCRKTDDVTVAVIRQHSITK